MSNDPTTPIPAARPVTDDVSNDDQDILNAVLQIKDPQNAQNDLADLDASLDDDSNLDRELELEVTAPFDAHESEDAEAPLLTTVTDLDEGDEFTDPNAYEIEDDGELEAEE